MELRFLGVGVDSGLYSFEGLELFGYFYFHGVEKCFTIFFKFLHKNRAYFLQRFDVDDVSGIVNLVVHLPFVSVKSLPLLFVLIQPLSWLRLAQGRAEIFDAL